MPLVFKKRLQPKKSRQLKPVEQDQLKQAAKRWNGQEVSDLDAFLGSDEGYVELHEVLEKGKRKYDAWVFPTDDASFFVAGTGDLLPFHVVQGQVKAWKPGGDATLRESVQKAYDRLFK